MATGITQGVELWKMQDNYVERHMDNAAYTAAHPDDTLVLAGPPRTPNPGAASIQDQLMAIGHLQQVQFSQQKPTQPMMAIGSGRSFFVSGKAQSSATFGRLFVNGRNLLRILNNNARQGGLDVTKMDDKPAVKSPNQQYYVNLDSELYLIPFGIGVFFRDKVHHVLGGFYAELSLITSYAIGFSAGQNMILEQSNVLFDRLLPFFENETRDYQISEDDLQKVIGFFDNTSTNGQVTSNKPVSSQ